MAPHTRGRTRKEEGGRASATVLSGTLLLEAVFGKRGAIAAHGMVFIKSKTAGWLVGREHVLGDMGSRGARTPGVLVLGERIEL